MLNITCKRSNISEGLTFPSDIANKESEKDTDPEGNFFF